MALANASTTNEGCGREVEGTLPRTVNIFVNTQEANTAITSVSSGKIYLKNGGTEGIRIPYPLLAKHEFRLKLRT